MGRSLINKGGRFPCLASQGLHERKKNQRSDFRRSGHLGCALKAGENCGAPKGPRRNGWFSKAMIGKAFCWGVWWVWGGGGFWVFLGFRFGFGVLGGSRVGAGCGGCGGRFLFVGDFGVKVRILHCVGGG